MAMQFRSSKIGFIILSMVLLSAAAVVCWALPPGHWQPSMPFHGEEGPESGAVLEDDCPGELVCAHWVWGPEHGNGEGGSSGPCCLTQDKLYATYVGACDAALRHTH